LRVLDSEPAANFLPTTAGCPICRQGRLRLIQDTCQIGAWFVCRACERAGDMIDLVCGSRNCADTAAAYFLREHGILDSSIDMAEALHSRRRMFIEPAALSNQMWTEAARQHRVVVDPRAQLIMEKLRLGIETGLSWGTNHISHLLGYVEADRLEDWLRPRRDTSPRKMAPRQRRIVPRTQSSAIVVPFYDVPKRIRSVTVIFPGDNSKNWNVSHHAIKYGSANTPPDGGLAMVPGALDAAVNNRVLLVSDVELYLRLTLKEIARSGQQLPLVCYHEHNPATNNWQLLGSREAVIWTPTCSPRAVAQAIHLNAKICAVPLTASASAYLYAQRHEPQVIVTKHLQAAVPWQELVVAVAQQRSLDDLTDWVADIGLSDAEQRAVLACADTKMRDKLRRAFGEAAMIKSIAIDGGFLEQRHDGWYILRGTGDERLVTNAPFAIREAITNPANSGITYMVEAHHNGQRFSFYADADDMRAKPFDIVHTEAVRAGIGVPTADHRWKQQALHWALLLHKPAVVNRLKIVGYDRDSRAYNLPRAVVDTVAGRWREVLAAAGNLPALSVSPSSTIAELKQLCQNKASRSVMAVYLAVVNQILCDIAGSAIHPVIVTGRAAGQAAGYLRQLLGAYGDNEISLEAELLRPTHIWPVFLSNAAAMPPDTLSRVLTDARLPVVISLSHAHKDYAALCSAATVVRSGKTQFAASLDCHALHRLTVEIIAHASRARFQEEFAAAPDKLAATYRIVLAALREHDIPWRGVEAAYKWCQVKGDTGHSLIAAVGSLLAEERLRHCSNVRYLQSDGVYLRQSKREYWVATSSVVRAVQAAGYPSIDADRLALQMSATTSGVSPSTVQNEPGWLLPAAAVDAVTASRILVGKTTHFFPQNSRSG
jgi:hypothetical protein